MNPLPRLLGTALFLVLAVLAALLAVPVWQHYRAPGNPTPAAEHARPAADSAAATPRETAPRLAAVSQHTALATALICVALSGALLFSLSLRSGKSDTVPPFAAARQEMNTLTKLAESTAAQGAELTRERDVRRRAEEDAQLKQQLLAQSVDEKIRLGQDLHDGIIQSLYAVGLTLETIRPLLKNDPVQAERRLDEVRGSLNTAIRDVRSYITGLAPENLHRASFSRGITALFDQLRAGRDAHFDIQVDDDAAALLTLEQNIEALQIAREAISNALRHGNASQITVRLHKGDGEVALLVQDNGRGFASSPTHTGGHGLANMRARAERLGASLRVAGQLGQGVRVIVTFPLRQNAPS